MEKQVSIDVRGHRLAGVLHIPDNLQKEKFPIVLICHGFISSKVGQHRLFVHAARQFCQAGFAVMRFDYIGCGESTGEYKDTTVTDQVVQTRAIIDYAASLREIDAGRIVLLGHSLGGGIAAVTAGLDERVNQLILWSPVGVPQQDVRGILGETMFNEGLREGTVNYQGFVLGRDFLASLAEIVPVKSIKEFQGDVFILHGDNDGETPVSNTALYDAALKQRFRGSHEIIVIPGADHTYNSPVWEESIISETCKALENFRIGDCQTVANL